MATELTATVTDGAGPHADLPAPGAPGGSSPNPSPGPAADPPRPVPVPSGTDPAHPSTQWTLDAALAEIERLRRENAAKRTAAKAPPPETSEQALQREIREIQQERDHAQTALQRERLATKFQAAAAAAYVVYPDLFIEKYIGQITFNDAGEPNNMGDLIAHARKHYPALFRVPSADGGAQGEPARPKIDMNALIRTAANRGGGG